MPILKEKHNHILKPFFNSRNLAITAVSSSHPVAFCNAAVLQNYPNIKLTYIA